MCRIFDVICCCFFQSRCIFHLSVIYVAFHFAIFVVVVVANNRLLRMSKIIELNSCVHKRSHIHFNFSQEIRFKSSFCINLSKRSRKNRLRNDPRVAYKSTSEYVTYARTNPLTYYELYAIYRRQR